MTRFSALFLLAAALPAGAQTVSPGLSGPTVDAVRQFNESADAPNEGTVLFPEVDSSGVVGTSEPGASDVGTGLAGADEIGECNGCGENAIAHRGVYGYDNPCPAGTIITPFGTCAVTD